MRRILIIAGAVIGAILVVVLALVIYAVVNLNSIIASNRGYILARASDAAGRPIQAQDIKASVGWGVMMDITNVKVADDPAFAQIPFVQAGDVYVKVQFLPLLAGSLKVTSLVLKQPQVRIIRNHAGVLNFSTMAKKSAEKQPAEKEKTGGGGAGLAAVTIRSLNIDGGKIYYEDQQAGGPPVKVNALNLKIDDFSVNSPFDVALTLAALSDQKNLDVSGKVGPLMHNGAIETDLIPLDLDVTLGPLALAQLKTIPQLAHAIPPQLSVSEPVSIDTKIGGTVGATRVDANGDLSRNHVVYQGILDKAAGVPFKFAASASRNNGSVDVRDGNLTLADAKIKATGVTLAKGNLGARIDSNNFDLAGLSKVLTAAQKYNPTGNVEIHTTVRIAEQKPSVDGTVALTKVNVAVPGTATPPLSDLSGTIRMAGNSANVGPMAFNLGSGHAKLQAAAQSLQPLKATYQFSADTVKVGELVPSRKDLGEQVSGLAANGNLSRNGAAIAATTNVASPSGMVANVPYEKLALAAGYSGNRLTIDSLKLNTFDGSVAASGVATLGAGQNFNLKLNADNVDVQKALEAQKAKAAGVIRGKLTAAAQVAGTGKDFDQIKPTLHGNGRANLADGKLVGINVVAQALNKVNDVPGIGALVPAGVVNNHPGLFKSNDTDIQKAALSFVLQGPKITTHDLTASAADYSLMGDGWFDMDKNIDLAARILMSKAFSNELVAAKHNVSYLTNQDGSLEIPLRITGQLPKPAVLPDVSVLAQRAAGHAVQSKLGEFLGGKKGGGGALGSLFGGAGSASGSVSTSPRMSERPQIR